MVRSIITFILLGISIVGISQSKDPYFIKLKPKSGDGMISFLSRYGLYEYDCNRSKFLELNNITEKTPLFSHKEYKLPIKIYNYNGKSIRTTIQDNNWDKAVRIQQYNEKILKSQLRNTKYTESQILWVPYHELACPVDGGSPSTTTRPKKKKVKTTQPKVLTQKLFGKKYEKVNIIDHSLKGQVYYVVSGHGGPDPGAQCFDYSVPINEDEYSYDIALRLARDLMQHGATVHVIVQDPNDGIRDDRLLRPDKEEKTLGKQTMPLKQKARLNQRAAAINKLYRYHKKKGAKIQKAIFLHIDSSNKGKRQDVYFYHHKKSKEGKKLAKNILKTFDKKYEKYQKGRGYGGHVSSRGLYVLNYTQPVSVFVELGNIRNRDDHRRIMISENRQALANWLFEGLTK